MSRAEAASAMDGCRGFPTNAAAAGEAPKRGASWLGRSSDRRCCRRRVLDGGPKRSGAASGARTS
jgi:hypothetical protein